MPTDFDFTPEEQDQVDQVVKWLIEKYRLKWYQQVDWRLVIPCAVFGFTVGFLYGADILHF